MKSQPDASQTLQIRYSNFELLRILAMFGIVIFHHFGNKTPGNFITLPEGFNTANYFYDVVNNSTSQLDFKTLLLDFCYGHFGNGGNLIFMMITGYFLYGRELRFEKRVNSVIKILFIVLFWGCILTVINATVVKFFYPFAGLPSYKPKFTLPNWLSGANMWYFQAYGVFLLVFIPFLKYFEARIDKKTHKCIIAMLVALCFLDYKTYLPSNGLPMKILEFILCYYIGGYVSKYSVRYSLKELVAAFITYILVYFTYEYYWRKSMRKMVLPIEYSYIDVMSPFICCLIFAVMVFLIFSKFNFKSNIINHISSATPGIYVFHYNCISTSYVIANTFWWKDWSLGGYCKFVLIDSLLLFVFGYLIDLIRQFLFSRIKKRYKTT